METKEIAIDLRQILKDNYPHYSFEIKFHHSKAFVTSRWIRIYKIHKRKYWFNKKILLANIDWTGQINFRLKNKNFKRSISNVLKSFNTIHNAHLESVARFTDFMASIGPGKQVVEPTNTIPPPEQDDNFELDGAL